MEIVLISVQPECRVCAASVLFFGDLCADCEEAEAAVNDLAAADQAALIDQRVAADG